MKARYITAQRDVNPLFDNAAKRAAQGSGEKYDIEPYIEVPVGFIEEGPLCWAHCVPGHENSPPVCEPVDDECRERVKKWMEKERPKALEQIRLMSQPENQKGMKKEHRQYFSDLAEVYGINPDDAPITELDETELEELPTVKEEAKDA